MAEEQEHEDKNKCIRPRERARGQKITFTIILKDKLTKDGVLGVADRILTVSFTAINPWQIHRRVVPSLQIYENPRS